MSICKRRLVTGLANPCMSQRYGIRKLNMSARLFTQPGPNPDFLLGGRTSASAECRHWSGRAVRWSSCAILQARFSRLTNGCALECSVGFRATHGPAVAHVRGSYLPTAEVIPTTEFASIERNPVRRCPFPVAPFAGEFVIIQRALKNWLNWRFS